MTAKEKLRKRVDGLSEEQANVALLIVDQNLDDPMLRALANAPEDDEPWTEEDERAVQEARDELAAGAPTVSHEEIKREFDRDGQGPQGAAAPPVDRAHEGPPTRVQQHVNGSGGRPDQLRPDAGQAFPYSRRSRYTAGRAAESRSISSRHA